MRTRPIVAVGSVLLAGACGIDFPEPFEAQSGAYAEFVPYADLEAELTTLESQQAELYLAISAADIRTGGLESLLLASRRRGVPVRAWLLLEDEQGYWPGEDNLAEFEQLVDEFWQWNRAAKLAVEWIVVDMEPPLETSTQLAAALEMGSLESVLPLLLANADADEHEAARSDWAAAVDGWHDRGISVAVVALPYVLDDLDDGDPDIQDMFESPIAGIDWDEVGFLVYQNLYTPLSGTRLGPALVYSYAQTAALHFGERSAVALGAIGTVGKNTSQAGYEDEGQLKQDIAAAAAAGVDQVHLFSVDGMLETGGLGRWLDEAPAPAEQPEPNADVDAARNTIRILDAD